MPKVNARKRVRKIAPSPGELCGKPMSFLRKKSKLVQIPAWQRPDHPRLRGPRREFPVSLWRNRNASVSYILAYLSAKPPKRPPPTVEPRDFVDNNDNGKFWNKSASEYPRFNVPQRFLHHQDPHAAKLSRCSWRSLNPSIILLMKTWWVFRPTSYCYPSLRPPAVSLKTTLLVGLRKRDKTSPFMCFLADTTATSFEEGPVDVPYGPITASPGQSPIKKHIQQYEYAESSSQTSGPHTYGNWTIIEKYPHHHVFNHYVTGPITASPRSSPPSFSMKSLEVSLDRDVAPAEPVRIYDYGIYDFQICVSCWYLSFCREIMVSHSLLLGVRSRQRRFHPANGGRKPQK